MSVKFSSMNNNNLSRHWETDAYHDRYADHNFDGCAIPDSFVFLIYFTVEFIEHKQINIIGWIQFDRMIHNGMISNEIHFIRKEQTSKLKRWSLIQLINWKSYTFTTRHCFIAQF